MMSKLDLAGPMGPRPTEVSIYGLLRFERLLSELSATFIHLPAQDVDHAIDDSLERIVMTLGIDRSTLARVFPLTGRVEVTHSFATNGVAPIQKGVSARQVNPWGMAMALANRPIVFERLDDLPPEAAADKEFYRSVGLKSHVNMPIVVAGQLHGALSFGCIRAERRWPEDLLSRMRLLSEVFGSALARKRAQEELDSAIGFERLASSILASLVLAKPGAEGSAIAIGLRQIGEFVGADQVALWLRSGAEARAGAVQHWQAEGVAAPIGTGDAAELPWIESRIAEGQVVRLARIGELPAEARVDSAALRARGICSLLLLPISVSGQISGALWIASLLREHEWPAVLTPGVSLLAEVFGSLQAREAAERRKLAAEVEAAHWRERLAHLVRIRDSPPASDPEPAAQCDGSHRGVTAHQSEGDRRCHIAQRA